MTRQAVEFLRRSPDDKPFCLSISTKAPHVQDGHPDPFRYDPALKSLYGDVRIPEPKTARERYWRALPEFVQESEGRVRWQRRFATPERYQHSVKGYYRLITGVDRLLGTLLDTLEATGQRENTVILFTSDNGFFLGERGLAGKWLMYDASIRTPLFIHDPRLNSNIRGRMQDEMTLNIDLAPTICDLAGLPPAPAMQGQSLVPLLYKPKTRWRDAFFYEHLFEHARIPQCEGVRTKRWAFIRYIEHGEEYDELYDLKLDPLEQYDVSGLNKYTDILLSMRESWQEWRERAR
jgi:arylsulfatase A-like enzyme